MSGLLTAMGPAGVALALLVLGHVFADFVFQTDTMAREKHESRPLAAHIGVVFVVHVVAFLPLLGLRTVPMLVAIVAGHLLIDGVTARVRHGRPPSVHLFLGDQLAHGLVILLAWWLLVPAALTLSPLLTAVGVTHLPPGDLTALAIYLSAFAFAHEGGNAIVRGVLPDEGPSTTAEDDLEAGSLIGSLERWLVLLLGVAGLWEAVALVVAAKSIARFEELKERAFAEYFLVGTLTSLLVAVVLVVLVDFLV